MQNHDAHKDDNKPVHLILTEYEITFEAVNPPGLKKMPKELHTQYQILHDLVQTQPQNTIPDLKKLLKKYPNEPRLLNLLASAYSMIDEIAEAKNLALQNYKKNPYYLFAKINYAHFCMKDNDLDAIPKIFKNKFDLKSLYPNRDKFHISEFIGFAGVVGEYFARVGKKDTAMIFYKSLKKIAPKHRRTKLLKSLLKPTLKQRILKKVDEKLQNIEKNIFSILFYCSRALV